MFHHGFEWPLDERQAFGRRMENEGWPSDWFVSATQDGDPWIFYLTKAFIAHTFATIATVLEGFGNFIRDELQRNRAKP